MPGEVTPGCMGTAGGRCLRSSDPYHAHPHQHAHKRSQGKRKARATPRCTADSMAIVDRRREHLDAKRMPNKKKTNRLYMPAECGGVTLPRSSPTLCACRQVSTREISTGRIGRHREARARLRAPHAWSGRPRTQGGGLTSAGGTRYGGLGWAGQRAPQKLDLQMPI